MYALDHSALIDRLKEFDKAAANLLAASSQKPRVIIVGGSAFALLGKTQRATHDIDVLSLPRELVSLIPAYDMNLGVNAYIDCLPYNYEDRLVVVDIGNSFLEYLTPSLEDLVVTKLYAMRPPDIEDISSERVIKDLDWQILEKLVTDKNEAAASILSFRRYKEMLYAFENYKREYGDEAADI